MKTNIGTVVAFEVVRTLRTKFFWIGSLLGPVLLAVVIGISVMSNTSASNAEPPDSIKFEWVDHSGLVNPSIAEAAGGTLISDPAQGVANVIAGRIDAFFEYPANPTTDPILVSAQDAGIFGSDVYPGTASQILKLSAASSINNDTLVNLVSGSIPTSLTTYKDGQPTPGIWGAIPLLAFIVLFFIIVVMQGNRMLTATLEEKENRVTEMILTTIKPSSLLTGKVLALGIIGVVQILVIMIPAAIVYIWLAQSGKVSGLELSKLVFEPVPIIISTLILLGGFLLFTTSLVAIGAAVPTVKDAQGMFATVLLLLVIPIYLIVWMMVNPGNMLVRVLTFFPWTAPITAMGRNALGILPWVDGCIVIAILFVTSYLVFRIAARLFQYGSVEYAKKIDVRAALRTK